VVELLSGFEGNPRSRFCETQAWSYEPGEDFANEEPANINSLLTTAPVAVDELIRQSGEGAAAVQLALLELEISGLLVRHAGRRVSEFW
jgi:DNA processing protein